MLLSAFIHDTNTTPRIQIPRHKYASFSLRIIIRSPLNAPAVLEAAFPAAVGAAFLIGIARMHLLTTREPGPFPADTEPVAAKVGAGGGGGERGELVAPR